MQQKLKQTIPLNYNKVFRGSNQLNDSFTNSDNDEVDAECFE